MSRGGLELLTRAELAERLAHTDHCSAQRHRLRAECARRAARWGVVAQAAALVVLGCMSLVALAMLLR